MGKQTLTALIQQGHYAEGLVLGEKLCKESPDDVTLWMILIKLYGASGKYEGVIHCCDRVIALEPGNVTAYYNRGLALRLLGRFPEAEQAFRSALSLDPSQIAAASELGKILKDTGRNTEAIKVYNKLLDDNPTAPALKQASIYASLAFSQVLCHLFEAAEESCRSALQLDPNCVAAHNNLAQALKERGLLAQSIEQQRETIRLAPDIAEFHSNLLLDLNYLTDLDPCVCAHEHRQWGERHGACREKITKHINTNDPNRRLRIGYVSPDFREHSVAFFITPLLSAHNRNYVEIFCYSNVLHPDSTTQYLAGLSDQWRNIRELDDVRLAELIQLDKIDILVDLAGHTSGNRLKVFGMKPAPIQVTWLGYPNTTGLREVDYRLTDEWADPPGITDELHTENLVRLPNGFLCYRPFDNTPEISAKPEAGNRPVTFGCFNNSAKINNKVLDTWCEILTYLPEARMLLKSRQLHDPGLRRRFREEIALRSVNPDRIDMLGSVDSTIEHLALYGRVDIALDTFPYNGTTTTCEALWMGVPVITLAGNCHASRVGMTLLHGLGLNELIASSPEEYRETATNLAARPKQLAMYGTNLRSMMRKSPLTNATGFAHDIEEAYRSMWHHWCKRATTNSC